jgi:hypothetical protein
MKPGRLLIRVGLGILTVAAVAAATVTFVTAASPPPGVFYGLIGLVEGQTLELHVSNVRSVPGVTIGSCQVTLTFFDAFGNMVMTKDATVGAGMSDSLMFTVGGVNGAAGDTVVLPVGRRTYFRAAVYFPAGRRGVRDSCVSSLEVITNGETSLFINPAETVESLTSNHNETLLRDTGK